MVSNIIKNKTSSRVFPCAFFKKVFNSFSVRYLLGGVTRRYPIKKYSRPIARSFIEKETTVEVFYINFANFYRKSFAK